MRESALACPICGGELHDDLGDRGWLTCFHCAHSLQLPPAADQPGPPASPARAIGSGPSWPRLSWLRDPRRLRPWHRRSPPVSGRTLASSQAIPASDWLAWLALGLAILSSPLWFDLMIALGRAG